MPARASRKRANFSLIFETLEERRLLSASISASAAADVRAAARAGPLDKAPSLFIEPQAGRAPIIRAINAARSQIRLGICNLSDAQIGDALAAAVARGVNVRVIADQADYAQKPDERAELTTLIGRRRLSSPEQSGLPPELRKRIGNRPAPGAHHDDVPDTDDFRGLARLRDRAEQPGCHPPGDVGLRHRLGLLCASRRGDSAVQPHARHAPPNLIWGPTDATAKLSQLIQSAHHTIDVTSELLGDPYLEGQLIAATHRGVRVRLITPLNPIGASTNAT